MLKRSGSQSSPDMDNLFSQSRPAFGGVSLVTGLLSAVPISRKRIPRLITVALMQIFPFTLSKPLALGMILLASASAAPAQDWDGFFANRTASVTYGPYIRMELGCYARPSDDSAD